MISTKLGGKISLKHMEPYFTGYQGAKDEYKYERFAEVEAGNCEVGVRMVVFYLWVSVTDITPYFFSCTSLSIVRNAINEILVLIFCSCCY